jgi:hypothetical protein
MAIEETGLRLGAPREGGLGDDAVWRNQIVELHVLAEHGDVEAASAAQRWLATDGEARRLWDKVDTDCSEIRSVSPAG